MLSKKCFKCRQDLPLSAFYRHGQMSDGHLGKCKECTKSDVRLNRRKKIDYYRAYDRSRGTRTTVEQQRKYRQRHPDKYQARCAVSNAIRDGRLVRSPCEKCGEEKVEAHHEDYSKPLDVRWLCSSCHGEEHWVDGYKVEEEEKEVAA